MATDWAKIGREAIAQYGVASGRYANQFFLPKPRTSGAKQQTPGQVTNDAPRGWGNPPPTDGVAEGEIVTNSRGEQAVRYPDGSIGRTENDPENMRDVSAPTWFDLQRITFLVLGVFMVVIGLAFLAAPNASNVLQLWSNYEGARFARQARKAGLDIRSGGGDAPKADDKPPPIIEPSPVDDGANDPRPDFGNILNGEISQNAPTPKVKEAARKASETLSGPRPKKTPQKLVEFPDNSPLDWKPKGFGRGKKSRRDTDDYGDDFIEASNNAGKATTRAGPLKGKRMPSNADHAKDREAARKAIEDGGDIQL